MIKAVVLDVDGVLTDGRILMGPDGRQQKTVNLRDVMGIARARALGVVFGIITGEDGLLVERIAEKLHIDHIRTSCKDKAGALRKFSEEWKIPLEEFAYIGDDINDVEALRMVGLGAVPADAHYSARDASDRILKTPGGGGVVRELLDQEFGEQINRTDFWTWLEQRKT